jgi:putative transposase
MTTRPLRTREPYDTDLTAAQWQVLEPLVPPPAKTGRPRTVALREVLNALFYLERAGCSWRLLPKEFPRWTTVRYYFDTWTRDGTWRRLNDALRTLLRRREGREDSPSAAILDSQSVKTTEVGGPRGFDGGKRVMGRKRFILVDTLGLLLAVRVVRAHLSEVAGGQLLLAALVGRFPRLQTLLVDQGYQGEPFAQWVQLLLGWVVEVVTRRPGQRGFAVLPKRWIVERSLAWLTRNRRLSKDYEYVEMYSETHIYIASIRLMTNRLARKKERSSTQRMIDLAA